jgi:hypothetical protein
VISSPVQNVMTNKDLEIFLAGWEASIKTDYLHFRQRKIDAYDDIVPKMERCVLHFANPTLINDLESEFYCHVATIFKQIECLVNC